MDSSSGLLEHVNEFSYTINGGEIFDSIATVNYILCFFAYLCTPVFTYAFVISVASFFFNSVTTHPLCNTVSYDQFKAIVYIV
jgi:hypothetical protein